MKESFISANAFPSKLIVNTELCKKIKKHKIPPVHIQLNPTNKCNLKCSFCSCTHRNRSNELPLEDCIHLLETYRKLGCNAVTITGGGEPLCYPYLNDVLEFCHDNNMKVGLTTNGILLKSVPIKSEYITWIRISVSDEAKLIPEKLPLLHSDLSFSYVLLKEINYDYLIRIIRFANNNGFTHIRLVDDILGGEDKIKEVKETLTNIDTKIVIFQGRKNYSHGSRKCLLSLLKPNIGPDGNIYPCCGVQYIDKVPNLNFGKKYSMGGIDDIVKIYKKQEFFKGNNCDRCYYSEYNYALNLLWDHESLQHKEFI